MTSRNLENLEKLYLFSNPLKEIPESLFKLKKLKSLHLDDCRLTHISKSLGNLRSLKNLNLAKNNLETLPASIGNLSKLEFLDIRGNNFHKLPQSLADLEQLSELKLEKRILRKNEFLQHFRKKNKMGYCFMYIFLTGGIFFLISAVLMSLYGNQFNSVFLFSIFAAPFLFVGIFGILELKYGIIPS